MKTRSFILSFYLTLSALPSMAYNAIEIDEFKAVFNEYPQHTPTDKTVDAPLAGNGDIGLVMAPSAGKVTFYVGKNDFWKSVPSYGEGKIMQPGGLDITADILKEGTYKAEQLPGTAEIKASFTLADNTLRMTSWVAATDNKVVIELQATKTTTLKLRLWSGEGQQSTTAQGTSGGCRWVSRSFENIEHLQWPCHIALALNEAEEEITLNPGERRKLVLTAYTNEETQNWKEKAIQEASSQTDQSIADLKKQHRLWWENFWNLSGIRMADRLLEQYYYQSQYIFACASREGKFAPGLWGPFITTDNAAWAGDYHFNYNYQGPYWASYSSNHICLTENYDQPILDYMDKGRQHAWNLFHCRGVLYPVGLGPKGLASSAWPLDQAIMDAHYGGGPQTMEDGVMMWQQKTNASFAAANMMMRFYSTYDEEYARKIYPFVVACADFWQDYLVFQDGRYVVIGDVFYETAPWSNYEGDFNCVVSLGMARMAFQSAKVLSQFLHVDGKRHKEWDNFLEHLSPFPVGKDAEGRESLDYREQTDRPASGTNRILMHGVLLPTGLTGPYTTPEYTRIMREDLGKWKTADGRDWGNSMGNGIETVYPGAARVGFPPRDILKYLKERITIGSYPNCYIYADGGGIETLAAVPATINEMMMQSYEGIVRIFPCWDKSMNGSFDHLRAYGAFLVSSAVQDGEIQSVTLQSEKGRECKMENPWPGKAVKLTRDGKTVKTLKGDILRFKTKVGETIELTRK